MELSDKTLQAIISLAAHALKSGSVDAPFAVMGEFWRHVADADEYLKEKNQRCPPPEIKP